MTTAMATIAAVERPFFCGVFIVHDNPFLVISFSELSLLFAGIKQ